MSAPRSRFIEHDGLKLHQLEWGSEGCDAIVLVHGSRLHAHVWNDFARRFSDRYHIIAIDQRGHGESAWGAGDEYRLDDLCSDLHAHVQARKLSRFTLVGHSLGGRVSLLYAHRHPSELERLVLVDITPGRPRPAAANGGRGRGEGKHPREFESEEVAIAYLARAMPRAPSHLVEDSVRHGMRRNDAGRYVWKYDPVHFARRVTPPPGLDLWQVASEIVTPTLLQFGSESDVVDAELASRLQKTMPRCTVERIEGAGHGLFTDRPDAFAESLERFLRT
jgi:esterase